MHPERNLIVAGYNRIILVGNLTRDPDFKQLSSGQPVCQLGIASNRQYRNKQTGAMVQEVCFVDVDVYGPQAESCNQYLQKGRAVLVEGRLKFDTWESPDGAKRSKHSIVADRVVFLAAGAGDTETAERPAHNDQASDLAKKLLSDEPAKPKAAEPAPEPIKPAKKEQPQAQQKAEAQPQVDAPNTGELAFNDEPPFQDDLPF